MRRFAALFMVFLSLVVLSPSALVAHSLDEARAFSRPALDPDQREVRGSVERPATLTYEQTAYRIMDLADRTNYTATTLLNGRVLIAGGLVRNAQDTYCTQADANVWTLTEEVDGGLAPVDYMVRRRVETQHVAQIPLNIPRGGHTATLLEDGRVLIRGGYQIAYVVDEGCEIDRVLDDPEIYDPNTNRFTLVSPDDLGPPYQTKVLTDGRVLVVQGKEVYVHDPRADTSTPTATLAETRTDFAATLLVDGTILIVGGVGSRTAERYNPTTGSVRTAGTMSAVRSQFQATLLADGDVLVTGGYNDTDTKLASAELYDPTANTFAATGSMNQPHATHYARRYNDGNVLVFDESDAFELYDPSTGTFRTLPRSDQGGILFPLVYGSFFVTTQTTQDAPSYMTQYFYAPATVLSGTLTLPADWSNDADGSFEVGIRGSSSAAPITDAAVIVDNQETINWLPLSPGGSITPTITLDAMVEDHTIALLLRDANRQTARVVEVGDGDDLAPPTTTVEPLPRYSNGPITLRWQGNDDGSGVQQYTVEVRLGSDGAWQPLLTATTATSTTYTGENGQEVYFRVRATDNAGNVEPWPATLSAYTTVDIEPPHGTLDITTVGAGDIAVHISTADSESGVDVMRVAFAHNFDGTAWETYADDKILSRVGAPAGCLVVVAQFRDRAGNISPEIRKNVPKTGCPGQSYQVYLPLVSR